MFRKLNKVEKKIIANFSKIMEEETIPQIIAIMKKRAISAQKSRRQIIW